MACSVHRLISRAVSRRPSGLYRRDVCPAAPTSTGRTGGVNQPLPSNGCDTRPCAYPQKLDEGEAALGQLVGGLRRQKLQKARALVGPRAERGRQRVGGERHLGRRQVAQRGRHQAQVDLRQLRVVRLLWHPRGQTRPAPWPGERRRSPSNGHSARPLTSAASVVVKCSRYAATAVSP